MTANIAHSRPCSAWNALLAVAFAFLVAMALRTPVGIHPDEKACIGAVRFHETRWLPADIRDPAAAPSFSCYGVSRLDQRTVYWTLAGKVSRLARVVFPRWGTPERFFNIVLFGMLLVLCLRRGTVNPWIYLPIGISPQVWYLFSYCTADAWDLFLSVLVFHEAVFPRSLLWQGILGRGDTFDSATLPATCGSGESGATWRRGARLLVTGSLFGMLSLGKPTVLAALLVSGVILVRRLADLPGRTIRRALPALIAFVLVAAAWPAASLLSEHARYGSRHDEIREEMAARYRHANFVPDERGIVRHASVNLRGRGISLSDMVLHHEPPFLPTTLASFAGSYGHMRYPSPRPLYAAIAGCWFALFVVWGVHFLQSRPRAPDVLAALALMAIPVLLLGASVWHSWTADYQPQGRYLFPSNIAWAALGALAPIAHCPGDGQRRIVSRIFSLLLVLGLWSFLLYGLVPMSAVGQNG